MALQIEPTPWGAVLLVTAPAGRRWLPYVARLTGRDPTYRYARQFVGRRRTTDPTWQEVVVAVQEFLAGEVVEIRDDAGTFYYQYTPAAVAGTALFTRVGQGAVEAWVSQVGTIPDVFRPDTGPRRLRIREEDEDEEEVS